MTLTMADLARSQDETNKHIMRVQQLMEACIQRLVQRSAMHDLSKLIEPELSGYAQLQTRLADVQYGSDEYKAALDEAAETVQHHYAHNDHHLEHYPIPVGAPTDEDITLIEQYANSLDQGDPVFFWLTDYAYVLRHRRNRVSQMSLLALIEMLCDWKAASERTKDGSLEQSLQVNRNRFRIDLRTERLLRNTAKELGWL